MKKIVSLLLVLFIPPRLNAYDGFSIANLATGNLSDYDKPLIDAIIYFTGSFWNFLSISLTIATAIGFIGIVWCAFKITFGTENIRKAAVDVMCKFLLYTFVMAFYPKITFGVLDLATNIGMHAGGGYASVVAKFGSFRKSMEDKVDLARREMDRLLAGIADSGAEDGRQVVLNPKVVEDIMKRTYISEDDGEKAALLQKIQEDYNIVIMGQKEANVRKFAERISMANPGLWIPYAIFNAVDKKDVYHSLNQAAGTVDENKAKAIAKQGWDSAGVRHAVISLKAMEKVFSKNPDYDPDMRGTEGYTTTKYLFNPFIQNDDLTSSILLSPGAMIKTGVVIADIINYQSSMEFDPVTGDFVDKDLAKEKKGFLSITMASIQESVFSFLFTVGIVAACVFFAVQYMMTIFEFFILTSVGILFVPCILWDGTKSFAAKLVTLFMAYFFKLMLMIFCLFWVYGFFIDMGMTLMHTPPVLSLLNVGYFLMAVMLGWVVTQNGPKLATALLNGTPDLSMGEFMRAAGTAAAGAYAAKKAVAGAGQAATAAHKGMQKGVNTFAGLDAMAKGVSSAVNAEGDKQGWSKGQRFAKTAGGVAGLIGQNIKNSASTFFTGVEGKGGHKENNVSNMGKGKHGENSGADGKQTYGDAKTAAHDYQKNKLDNENNSKPKASTQTPPDTTPKFDSKRDTSA